MLRSRQEKETWLVVNSLLRWRETVDPIGRSYKFNYILLQCSCWVLCLPNYQFSVSVYQLH
jgi:hypothetical protein